MISQKITVMVKGQQVELDPANLNFSEATLSEYLEHEGGWYDYYASKLAEAEHTLQLLEIKEDETYGDKFTYWKEEQACGSDKLAENKTKSDPDVVNIKQEVADAKRIVRLLQLHLRAWDKNHDNVQSKGHFLRKEMDKLNRDIMTLKGDEDYQRIADVVKPYDPNA